MGVSHSPAQLAAKFGRLTKTIGDLDRTGVAAAAMVVKTDTQREMSQAVGAERIMSGVGRRGARIGTTFVLRSHTAFVRAYGPAHLAERGARPHVITPKRRRRGGKRGMSIPGVGVRTKVQHPGAPGKYPWRKGVATATPKVVAAFHAGVTRAMVKVFG